MSSYCVNYFCIFALLKNGYANNPTNNQFRKFASEQSLTGL